MLVAAANRFLNKPNKPRQPHNTTMKLFARIGAVLLFTSFFIGGVSLISLTRSNPNSDAAPIVAVGLFFIGTAFFVGPMLWLASEKARAPRDGA